MLGKLLGAAVGAKVAEHSTKVGGVSGALLGAGSVALIRRMSFPALIAVAAAGYAYTRLAEKKRPAKAKPRAKKAPAAAAAA